MFSLLRGESDRSDEGIPQRSGAISALKTAALRNDSRGEPRGQSGGGPAREGYAVLQLANVDTRAIDVLYAIDGQLMPPVLEWRLDSRASARIFADMSTPARIIRISGDPPLGKRRLDPGDGTRDGPLARISRQVSSRGGADGHGTKARDGRIPQAYLTVRRGIRPSATQLDMPGSAASQKLGEKCGLAPMLFT